MKKILSISILLLAANSFAQAQNEKLNVKPLATASSAKLNKLKQEINTLYAQFEKQSQSNDAVLAEIKKKMEDAMKELEAQDRMGNFEIQRLMSDLNETQILSNSIKKKLSDTKASVIQKIGSMAGWQ